MFLLDNACWPIHRTFTYAGDERDTMTGLYLVGSTMTGKKSAGSRDTDVRLMLSDKKYDQLKAVIGMTGLRFLGIAIGQYLASTTGLPIDFQIQQTTAANEEHGGGYRNPLGTRDIDNYVGDGEPETKPAEDLTEREAAHVQNFLAQLTTDREDT